MTRVSQTVGKGLYPEKGRYVVDYGLNEAIAQKERLMEVTAQLGLRCVSLDDAAVGVGFALEWAGEGRGARIVVVSIPGGQARTAYTTSGALADASHGNRNGLLEACNSCVAENSAFPVYLHDADAAWDVLVQTCHPVELLVDIPPFLKSALQQVPLTAERVRERLSGVADTGGRPYGWEDLDRLLLRSLM